LGALGSRTLTCDCDVIQADGGTRTAAITGAYIALEIALHGLIEKKIISPLVISKQIAAVSVGIVDGIPMLDLCYEEDQKAEVDANIVMDSEENYIEIQSTAEKKPFSQQQLNEILKLAKIGIFELFKMQRSVLDESNRLNLH
jgi:ribonuclease PH